MIDDASSLNMAMVIDDDDTSSMSVAIVRVMEQYEFQAFCSCTTLSSIVR
jgi:hypothetical protein